MEAAYIKPQKEYPSVFNSDGSIIEDNTQSSLNGHIIEKYDGLTKALENNNVDTSGLKGLLEQTKEIQNKVNSFEKQLDVALPETPNENSKIEIEYNSDNSVEIKHPNNTTDIISNNIKTTYDENNNQTSTTSLKDGQTISHIATNTPYNSIELLEYNNLTLEQAKNLPVGFEVQIPKHVTETTGEYGSIKIYEGYDETGVIVTPNEKIRYDENSDLVIYGDNDKITFTNIETGNYQEWSKDSNGSMYQSLESTDNLSISYEMIDGVKVANNIEILSDNVNLDDIANPKLYSKELSVNNKLYERKVA